MANIMKGHVGVDVLLSERVCDVLAEEYECELQWLEPLSSTGSGCLSCELWPRSLPPLYIGSKKVSFNGVVHLFWDAWPVNVI